MAEWKHEQGDCPHGDECTENTECKGFPTIGDRTALADALHNDYMEAGEEVGTQRDSLLHLLQDMVLNCRSYDWGEEAIKQAVSAAFAEFTEHNTQGQPK